MKTVLLVIREEGTRDALCRLLKDRCRLLVCGQSAEAYVLLQQKPDAMILDLFLPGEDGLSFLKKTIPAHPPVILVLSELMNEDILEACSALGISCLFLSPCSCDAVARKLTEILEKNKKVPLL